MDELFALLHVYVKGIWKYRWMSVIVAWLVAVVGWTIVYKMPDNFQATARIYVDTQNILNPLMAGMTVTPNAQRQVSIISRTLINRPNIERIIRMVDLDITLTDDAAKERLITELMGRIQLNAERRDNIFTISYNNEHPVLAQEIVQSLLTIFVEEGIGGKKDQSLSAIRFVDQQIKEYERKLAEAERRLTIFKQKNIGLLPGESGDFYTQLITAQKKLKEARLALLEAKHARSAIKRQITGDEPVFVLEPFNKPSEAISNPKIDARISALNENLDTLRLNFTEQHPDIIATKRLISKLEERKQDEILNTGQVADLGRNFSPMLQQLNIALAESEAVIASLEARVSEYTDNYSQLKTLSAAVPRVEAEFTQLNRDYNVNRLNYEKLLGRRISAQMSDELTSTSGLSFRIVDPPTVPEIPDGPNRILFFSAVLVVALGMGLGTAFVASQIRPAFHSQSSLSEITGIDVLGTVPMVWTKQEMTRRTRRLYAFCFTILLLFIACGAVIANERGLGKLFAEV